MGLFNSIGHILGLGGPAGASGGDELINNFINKSPLLSKIQTTFANGAGQLGTSQPSVGGTGANVPVQFSAMPQVDQATQQAYAKSMKDAQAGPIKMLMGGGGPTGELSGAGGGGGGLGFLAKLASMFGG